MRDKKTSSFSKAKTPLEMINERSISVMELGEKLAYYRHAKGLTQCEAAKMLHVSRQCLGNWEAGRREPSIEAFARICQLYGITAELLFPDELEY
ncbi:helix-turn-helix transcriptional regulator [Diplocloster agilis]